MITAKPVEPGADRRNSEVFTRTLFSRDDQIFHVLDAGINAGQHEGGGKSLEIRRFGSTRRKSRLPGEGAMWRIHGTPGYPLTAAVGLTFRLKGK